jgi:hypothetical protein
MTKKKPTKRTTTKKKASPKNAPRTKRRQRKTKDFCKLPIAPERAFDPRVNNDRMRLIRVADKKWVNGTTLHYYFFTSSSWRGTTAERDVVRDAFQRWKDIGIGLNFQEVDTPDEAEIRVGFQRGDGAWSYLGRDVLNQGQTDRTMNFGWNISNDLDTALHEIGHTLGFPHEHQNPNSGIVWDEEAVYAALAEPPNNWDRETTHWNIIRKLRQSDVDGSAWDRDSIMHYPFEEGLILEPSEFRTQDLVPAPGLSPMDIEWARHFYPSLTENDYRELKPFRFVRASLDPGEQVNFYVRPTATRWYNFQTFGNSDTVMVLFEMIDGEPRYRSSDDDSGVNLNAQFEERLYAGRTYVLRIRLYWQHRKGDFGVMTW